MSAYIARRILFMIPTLLGIMLVSFLVVQFAPGGPVERMIAKISGQDTGATSRISGSAVGQFWLRDRIPGEAGAVALSSQELSAPGLLTPLNQKIYNRFGFTYPADGHTFTLSVE